MKKKWLFIREALLLISLAFVGSSCNDDDNKNWESNSPRITFKNVSEVKDFVQSGDFEALPEGGSSSFSFSAAPGQSLMLATKLEAANDLFLAPANPGIPLYDSEGNALTGVQNLVLKLWDNGTLSNQSEMTPTMDGVVREVVGTDDEGMTYPAASELLQVELAYDVTTSLFTCTLTNNSASTTLPSSLSAGVYAVSNVLRGALVDPDPLFKAGEKSSDELTALAETGNNALLLQELTEDTGIMTTLNGAIVVIYRGEENPLYTLNEPASGLGLAVLAQTGDPRPLETALLQFAHVKRVYASRNVVMPGQELECIYWAHEDDKIAYALSFGYSNDWFFTNGTNIKARHSGDVTSQTLLLDSGTAVDQYPGAGAAQNLFGGVPTPESNPVSQVGTEYPVPAVNKLIQVTMR